MPLKIIPPTSRERKRYLLVKIETDSPASKTDVENAIVNAGLQFLGELGMGRSGLQALGETFNGKSVIVKTGHKYVDETKAAISLINSIGNRKARLSITRVTGAIKNLKQ